MILRSREHGLLSVGELYHHIGHVGNMVALQRAGSVKFATGSVPPCFNDQTGTEMRSDNVGVDLCNSKFQEIPVARSLIIHLKFPTGDKSSTKR